ncbi:hypothetical protein G6F40_016693 [Rhizopus arrhizus]|nr:hypothetical protein G6F40_016693 [Rhizopus arrhizus]
MDTRGYQHEHEQHQPAECDHQVERQPQHRQHVVPVHPGALTALRGTEAPARSADRNAGGRRNCRRVFRVPAPGCRRHPEWPGWDCAGRAGVPSRPSAAN